MMETACAPDLKIPVSSTVSVTRKKDMSYFLIDGRARDIAWPDPVADELRGRNTLCFLLSWSLLYMSPPSPPLPPPPLSNEDETKTNC